MSLLPLLDTGVTHVIIAPIHISSRDGISLNDDRYNDPKNEPLWTEVRTLQRNGVKVLGMLSGAHQGSFTKLDGDIESFEAHYKLPYEMVKWIGLTALISTRKRPCH